QPVEGESAFTFPIHGQLGHVRPDLRAALEDALREEVRQRSDEQLVVKGVEEVGRLHALRSQGPDPGWWSAREQEHRHPATRTTMRFASATFILPERTRTSPSLAANHPGAASSSASVVRRTRGSRFSVTPVTSAPHVATSITLSRWLGAPA